MSITPLGSPVLPLEKMTVAEVVQVVRRSWLTARPTAEIAPADRRRQTADAQQRRRVSPQCARVGGEVFEEHCFAGTFSFTFSRNAFEVMTVLISHCRMHEASVSSETV